MHLLPLLLLLPAAQGGSRLLDRLRDFEVMPVEGLVRRVEKRQASDASPSGYNRVERLELGTKHRRLRLSLTPTAGLFAPDFAARVRSPDKAADRLVTVDTEAFFTGHVFGEPRSSVSAHLDPDGALTAAVATQDEVFHFEPAWRHLPDAPPNATLAYRASDLREDVDETTRARCGLVDPPHWLEPEAETSTSLGVSPAESLKARFKRALSVEEGRSSKRKRCSLKLVADYRFFREIGGRDEVKTIAYLANLISRVNDIYQKTVWRDFAGQEGLEDRAFLIKSIVVHDAPTPRDPSRSPPHYNEERERWDVETLLNSFTASEGSRPLDLCLAHLFTYQSFENGVLGLGYIASPRVGTSGGICSAPSSGKLYYNSALSSAKSTYGDAVITREADIVTAHELGHNWGAPHDPNTAECSPAQAQGGPFVMHTYSVSGFDPNNKHFSPCTLRSVKKVLLAKAELCFSEPTAAYCGNRRVEEGEECDAGVHGDACCSVLCRLRPAARCSANNSECCLAATCDAAPASLLCRSSAAGSCARPTFCDGRSFHCPPARPVADGQACLDDGQCRDGECVDFCQRLDVGLLPCICENVTESCFRCCKDGPTGPCRPFASAAHPLKLHRDQRPCIFGFCDEDGQCIRREQDVVNHLWNVVANLDSSSFRKFMEDNLVGFIILFSLLVWVPASCLVHRIDREREGWAKADWGGSVDGALSGRNRIEVARSFYNSSFSPSPSVSMPKPVHL